MTSAQDDISNNDIITWSAELTCCQLSTGKVESKLNIDTCGSIIFEPNDASMRRITLTEVLFSPNASANIVSLRPFVNADCDIVIKGDSLQISQCGKVILRGVRNTRGLYTLSSHHPPKKDSAVCMSLQTMSKVDSLQILHSCLGHLHPDAIKRMIREKMVLGLPSELSLEATPLNCPHCAAGKGTHTPYPSCKESDSSSIVEKGVGDENVSDSFGPIRIPSRDGI